MHSHRPDYNKIFSTLHIRAADILDNVENAKYESACLIVMISNITSREQLPHLALMTSKKINFSYLKFYIKIIKRFCSLSVLLALHMTHDSYFSINIYKAILSFL